MYIEFELPKGTTGITAGSANTNIEQVLSRWSSRYQIAYISKTIKYTKRVTFDQDEFYSLFALTWGSFDESKHSYLNRWRIVSDLNNKTEFSSRV